MAMRSCPLIRSWRSNRRRRAEARESHQKSPSCEPSVPHDCSSTLFLYCWGLNRSGCFLVCGGWTHKGNLGWGMKRSSEILCVLLVPPPCVSQVVIIYVHLGMRPNVFLDRSFPSNVWLGGSKCQ